MTVVTELGSPANLVTEVVLLDPTQSVSETSLSVLKTSLEVTAPALVTLINTGPTGPPGPSAVGGVTTLTAVAAVGGHRVLSSQTGGVRHTDFTLASDWFRVVGLSLGAANLGDEVEVRRQGLVEELSWTWTPDLPVFGTGAGQLTQVAPATTAFLLRVGVALTPTKLFVDFGESIIL